MSRLSAPHQKALRNWLRKGGYRPGTIRKVMTDVRTLLDRPEVAQQPSSAQRARDYQWAYDAYKEWGAQLPNGRPPRMKAPGIFEAPRRRNRRNAPKQRTLEAVALEEADWQRVLDQLQGAETAVDLVLAIMCKTAMRVGDVLRTPLAPVERALARADGLIELELKGGKEVIGTVNSARPFWARLVPSARSNVAELVSGNPASAAGSPAYKRVDRRWRHLCDKLGVQGRHNLHRIRRTVTVRLLEAGVPREVVSEVLGHDRLQTIKQYDEYKAKLVVGALARLERKDA